MAHTSAAHSLLSLARGFNRLNIADPLTVREMLQNFIMRRTDYP